MARATNGGTVVVTGASGGIGSLLVERLAARGLRVYACSRSGIAAVRDNVIPIALDVTRDESISALAARLEADLGGKGLAGLVNAAGLIVEGPLELIPSENFRTQFEVNVTGPFAVTRAMLPLLRKAGGRVVNIGAATAHVTVPFLGAISASKAALASVNDAMRMEFAPFGVAVALIEPGAIQTGIFQKSSTMQRESLKSQPLELLALYEPAMKAMQNAMAESGADRPEVVVDAIEKALFSPGRPKARAVVGKGAGMLVFLRRLPVAIRDRMLMSSLGIAKAMKSTVTKQRAALQSVAVLAVGISLGLAAMASSALADPTSPVGRWRTIDDATGVAQSIVEIRPVGGTLQGRVVKILNPPHGNPNPVCDRCSGERKNQPVLGMTFLWGLSRGGDSSWSGGSILDPHSGSIYRARLNLDEDGRKLQVRGYIGISLFGRTQIWLREE